MIAERKRRPCAAVLGGLLVLAAAAAGIEAHAAEGGKIGRTGKKLEDEEDEKEKREERKEKGKEEKTRGEGKIERTREKIEDGEEKEGKRRRGSRGRERHRAWEEDDDDGFAAVFLFTVLAPFWIPPAILWDEPFPLNAKPYRFEDYPYAEGAPGHLCFLEPGPEGAPAAPHEPDLSLRTLYAYECDDDDLDGHRFEAVLRSNARLNLDFSITEYTEDLAGGEEDHLWHWKTHMTYSFAVSPRAHFAAGIGARGLVWEGNESSGGVDFRYEAEFFPAKPLHLWFAAEVGNIEDECAFEIEGRVGVLHERFEAFVGYRHFEVADEPFAGPTVGVACWF